jgi:predicted HTH transcriptional regulator
MVAKKKPINEEFAKFYENPTREGLRDLLKNNLGEFPNCDFKEQWPVFSKVARHLLGLANSGGGCLIIGVAEREDKSLESAGIGAFIDKAKITDGVKKFIPNILLTNLQILDFSYEAAEYPTLVGKKFQALLVEDDPEHLPFLAAADGDGINNNAIYVRRGTATDAANHEELQRVINRRLETGHSTKVEIELQTHIEQLKMLYSLINKYRVRVTGGIMQQTVAAMLKNTDLNSIVGQREKVLNPLYPKESYEEFIARMIDRKKRRIEIELDVLGLSSESSG